jgi:tight adherence protein C
VIFLLPLLGFIFISLLVTAGAMALAPSGPVTLERRLEELSDWQGKPLAHAEGQERGRAFLGGLKRLGTMGPHSTKEMGKLQKRLVNAGYRGSEALPVFFGIRVGFALLMFVIFATPILMTPNLMLAAGACGVGYVLPSMVLGRIAKKRQHRIRLGLPDALDLMVVSVEAGLGLDQAIQRVADEMAFAHPDLADELRLINLELRAGKARAEALHNLGVRTGVDDVESLVAMLVQTDKFGTSVAQSLRVHSDTLRTKRRQRAEEAAAKTGVKMVFPLVFCIFPSVWVVTIGPAVIKFVQVIFPLSQK